MSLKERFQARIPSVPAFLRRVAADRRRLTYDLLPLVSTPAARARIARLVALTRPKTPDFQPSAVAKSWKRALDSDGITAALPSLPDGWIAEMRQYFQTEACIDPFRPHLGHFRWDAVPSLDINMGYFSTEQTLKAPHVLEIFNDPRVLETAELYLGCKPMLDNIGCWWSYGDRPAAKGTQRYHRDFDSIRGFKLFVYLTDVDAGSGPHVFMKGSHTSPILDTGKAQSDEAVRAAFGAENEIHMTGPAGTWFLADTFGFHKGALPETGTRLILVAQYNLNRTPHLPPTPVMPRPDDRLDPFVNRLLLA
ncbi:MAG TPA: hypothetical protein VM689_12270 [Aliidongia sp.]|nr:hypothetical protein [Aliidongia sp.]